MCVRVCIYIYIYIYIYIEEVCKSIFAWNSAQYVEAEQNKYYERKKRRNYVSRRACFVNRFTLQGFNIYIYIIYIYIYYYTA